MMRSFFAERRLSPIGIEIAGRTFRAAQLAQRGGSCTVEAASIIPRKTLDNIDASELTSLMTTLSRQGFHGKNLVVGIPRDQQLVTELLVPEGEEDSVEQIARRDFSNIYGEQIGSLEMAWWRLPAQIRAMREQHVRVTACAHSDSESLLDGFEHAGYSPRALDSASFAIARVIDQRKISFATALDVDWTAAHLVVIRDGFVIFERSIPGTGLRDLCTAMTADLTIDDFALDCIMTDVGFDCPIDNSAATLPPELRSAATSYFKDLAAEVRGSLNYLADTYPDSADTCLRLIGEGSTIPGFAGELAAGLTMDVIHEPAGTAVTPISTLESLCATGELTTAIGLALYDG